jgi:PAS domain S-box-containing protein
LNKQTEKITGISTKKAIGKSIYEILPKIKGSNTEKIILNTLKNGQSQSILCEYQIKNENKLFKITTHSFGGVVYVLASDINEYFQTEDLQKLETLILERLNKSDDQETTIHDIILLIKTYTKFNSIGIRLKEGDDYPYYITKGFSSEFIKSENSLCARDKSGNLVLDKSGNPFLECLCGNIIKGRIDSNLPFFTERGSFWTNSTSKFIETTTEKERQTKTRNKCNIDGYETVALIPLHSDEKVVGLMQLNDKRENMLNYNTIRILEGLAASIGTALSRKKAIKTLELSEQRYLLAQRAANIGSWDWDIKTGELTWSEKIEPMFGFKKGGFKGTYEAFLDCIHPDDREFVVKSVDDCVKHKKRYAIEHRIVWPNGNIRWVLERGDVIRDKNDNPQRMLGVVQDITNKKEMEEELKKRKEHLEKMVEERTAELIDMNKKLKDEIVERKKAETYIERTKENLRNIIDSASELIISFDMNNRISNWNKTAENLTGYKNIEVINRSVGKLDVFDSPESIVDLIIHICEKRKHISSNIILKTKDNEKKIIQVSGSDLKSSRKECIGALLIGTDITRDTEIHGKLIDGSSYLILDKDIKSSINLFTNLALSGHKGMFITRSSPSIVKSILPKSKDLEILLLSQEKFDEYETISNLEELINKIDKFSSKYENSVILIDGIHYLLTRFSFEIFIENIFKINDKIARNKSILFLRIDPKTFEPSQLAVIQNEIQMLPSQKIEGLIIEDEVYGILKYIYEQNQLSSIVSYKKVMKEFKIAYLTAANKLETLIEKGLIITKREGKLRTIYITEKGKTLLHKRQKA